MSASSSRSGSAQHTAATTPRSSPSSYQGPWTNDVPRPKGNRSPEVDLTTAVPAIAHSFPSSGSASGSQTAAGSTDQWWEHVLPPGQLAERLRRAQMSSDARSSTAARRFKTPLAGATPSERKVWKGFSELDQGDTVRRRGASHRVDRSARSSAQTSAEASSDESASHSEQHSPDSKVSSLGHYDDLVGTFDAERYWSGLRGDPAPRSFSRSGSARRARVHSEDGLGLGIASTSTAANTHKGSQHAHLRHFGYSGFVSPTLSDTPEVSSNDESEDRHSTATTTAAATPTTTTTFTTTSRHSRTVSMTSTVRSGHTYAQPPAILRSHFDRSEDGVESIYDPGSGRDRFATSERIRHVSFDGDLRDVAKATAAAAAMYRFPTAASQPIHSAHERPSHFRDGCDAFEGFASRSNSTRRSRHGFRSGGHHHRASSYSAPVSPRGSMQFHGSATVFGGPPASRSSAGHRRASSIPDVALLDSLNVAQNQLATAGNLAATLTRQLSAPLRPVFHLTLFLSISSITLVSLACFLAAGYFLTAWDDLATKRQRVGAAAGSARKNLGATVAWGMHMLSDSPSPASRNRRPQKPASETDDANADGYDIPGSSEQARSRTHRAWPVSFALASASAVACRVLPKPLYEAMGLSSTGFAGGDRPTMPRGTRPREAGTRPSPASTSRLPPRPPLSLLLPSIFFTLLIAVGAGLASFFASRRAAAASAGAGEASFPRSGFASPRDTGDRTPPDLASTAFFQPQPSAAIGRSNSGGGAAMHDRRRSRTAFSPSLDSGFERFAAATSASPILAPHA
ncbi:uncharacterized protein PFL1_05142 [Pseudozyma flocculosa PF-1]|uniref:Uncharacterized protein n=2 Tax=Pseudozyma flocculosa TaxID=84751 RepID=A0A5C3F772_9BASI|nr:uncharacterized protein PFL1_05142 [Pseudozyma flocculosa PF-1]EPQ27219.1 hypothetical protein PFL1_05142 [Pseudozyma flocculosa PF-1]SPO39585.1 uncharacterized protein PSFLO_05066 [Pseudozyma flocculosa]